FGGDQKQRRYIGAGLTDDERFLVIDAANTTSGNELYIQDLSKPGSGIINIVDNFEKEYSIVDNEGESLLIYTNLNAPNYRVVRADLSNLNPASWKDIIPETENVLNIGTGGGRSEERRVGKEGRSRKATPDRGKDAPIGTPPEICIGTHAH